MDKIPWLDADAVTRGLPWSDLIDGLDAAFRDTVETPVRLHGDLSAPSTGSGTSAEQRDLLVMPAWRPGAELGVKLVTLFEHNAQRHKPRIQGVYLLFHPEHGAPVAMLDAAALTTRRTAAASALAARYLARERARTLLVCGSGNLARALPQAHASVRPLEQVQIWARRPDAAAETASDLQALLPHVEVTVATDLEQAVAEADIVSTAVPSQAAFLKGAWLRPGTHVDLVGSYRADMHEMDTAGLLRAQCFVDTRDGVLAEAGEFIDAIAAGLMSEHDLLADLAELVSGAHRGRSSAEDITLFKSVGTALEDLAAARIALRETPAT